MSLINVGLRLLFLRKYSRPYAVIPDPTFICNPTFIRDIRVLNSGPVCVVAPKRKQSGEKKSDDGRSDISR